MLHGEGKELANRMGGSVRAESNGTRGTTITVEIRQKVCGSTLHDAVCYTTDSLLRESVVYTERIQPTWIYPGAHVLLADDMRFNQEISRNSQRRGGLHWMLCATERRLWRRQRGRSIS